MVVTMHLAIVILVGFLLFSNSGFSMGGDKLGPNGGYITMPGTYHLELIDKGDTMQVYLLDIGIKNPTIMKSSVSLQFINGAVENVKCKAEKKYFVCNKPGKNLGNYIGINVESIRNNIKGRVAKYKLPLQLDKP